MVDRIARRAQHAYAGRVAWRAWHALGAVAGRHSPKHRIAFAHQRQLRLDQQIGRFCQHPVVALAIARRAGDLHRADRRVKIAAVIDPFAMRNKRYPLPAQYLRQQQVRIVQLDKRLVDREIKRVGPVLGQAGRPFAVMFWKYEMMNRRRAVDGRDAAYHDRRLRCDDRLRAIVDQHRRTRPTDLPRAIRKRRDVVVDFVVKKHLAGEVWQNESLCPGDAQGAAAAAATRVARVIRDRPAVVRLPLDQLCRPQNAAGGILF